MNGRALAVAAFLTMAIASGSAAAGPRHWEVLGWSGPTGVLFSDGLQRSGWMLAGGVGRRLAANLVAFSEVRTDRVEVWYGGDVSRESTVDNSFTVGLRLQTDARRRVSAFLTGATGLVHSGGNDRSRTQPRSHVGLFFAPGSLAVRLGQRAHFSGELRLGNGLGLLAGLRVGL